MDVTKRTETNYRKWRTYLMGTLSTCYKRGFARHQWELYWSGVRDVRLHDSAIWLIGNYGY